MMRSNRTFLTCLAVAVIPLLQIGPAAVVAADATIQDMAQDIVPVQIQLNVSWQVQHRYPAGDPPITARDSTEISFRSTGVYTLIRFKPGHGLRYFAAPGFLTDPQFPTTTGLSVYQTHTCLSNEGLVHGRASKDLSQSARVHPASGGITLSEAKGPGTRVRLNLGSWEVETDHVACTTQPHCWDERTFWFDGPVGEAREQWVETPEGHEEYLGLMLAELDWNLIKSLAEGGELALVIPIGITYVQHSGDETPGESTVEIYTVTGVIAPADELPLAPLVPQP